MELVEVSKLSDNQIIGQQISFANSFLARFLGLMTSSKLLPGQGLLIKPCNSIHMFFMNFSIDVLFLDENYKIIKLIENLKPWRISPVVWKSKMVLELPTGTINRFDLTEGERLKIKF